MDPFYGLQSKKRNLNIKRTLESRLKRLKEEKIPSAYHSSLLGPSSRWNIFYRQQEALNFASRKTEDLHVFAFESQQRGKQSGQRLFLTATYDVFWHYYMQLDESQRHHYEVIPEGHPCKLYFDLEFHKPTNPDCDGDMMVDILIKYVCSWMRELYKVQCSRNEVLELCASTETKFSRHLVFQTEGNVFRDNVTAGDFVRTIFSLLEDELCETSECTDKSKHQSKDSGGIPENNPVNSSSVSVPRRGVCDVGDGSCECKESVGGINVELTVNKEHRTENLVCCTCDQSEGSISCALKPKDFSSSENKEKSQNQYEEVFHELSVRAANCEKHSHGSKNSACDSLSEKEELSHRQKGVHLEKACDSVTQLETAGGGDGAQKNTQISQEKLMEVRDAVFSRIPVHELKSLFVRNKEGKVVCFADLGVFTKNRNFRLYKSRKMGKTTAFTVAQGNEFSVPSGPDSSNLQKEIFLASLITNIRGSEKLLTFGDAGRKYRVEPFLGCEKTRTVQSPSSGELIEGYGRSPYPEVDDFINSQVSQHGGAIRRWSYFPSAEILSYDIVGYRFCHNVQRQHRSNNIKLVADLQKAMWYQKCYDPDCQAVNFKSEEFALPGEVLPANYLTEDFDDVDNTSLEEDEDACLLALEDAEQSLMTSATDVH